jgi:hypothetical protein
MSPIKSTLSIAILLLTILSESSSTAASSRIGEETGAHVTAQGHGGACLESQSHTVVQNVRSAAANASGRDPKLDPRRELRSILVHRDPAWGYSLMWPQHWQRSQLRGTIGTIYTPEDDPRTGFYLFLQDMSGELGGPVTAGYVVARQKEVRAELDDLPNCEVVDQQWITKGSALGFEVLYTFGRDEERRVRLMRVLYHGTTRYVFYEQGASPYEYGVFYDTFEFMYSTFTFGDLMALVGPYQAD